MEQIEIIPRIEPMRHSWTFLIGEKSVKKLFYFIQGYKCALFDMDAKIVDFVVLSYLDTHIRSRYNVTYGRAWDDVLMFFNWNEEEAWSAFWESWDESVKRYNTETVLELPTNNPVS